MWLATSATTPDWLGYLISFAWCIPIVIVIAGIFSSVRNGKSFHRPHFPDARLDRNWVSGRSLWSAYTAMNHANSCLWITVTSTALHIGVHFPFSLFLPSREHYQQAIKGKDILAVEQRHKALGGDGLTITFRRSDGAEEQFLIETRQLQDLERAIDAIRPAGTTTTTPPMTDV